MTLQTLPRVLTVYKECGETPLECLRRLQAAYPILSDVSLTYAGRLDPMAEGVLLVLVGEEGHRKEAYLNLRKSYRVQVLFGWSTDTYDLAGKLTQTSDVRISMVDLVGAVAGLERSYDQPYPPYSSKPVSGQPLFQWARQGRLSEIEIPTHHVTIYGSALRHLETISGGALWEYLDKALSKLTGDFRQEEIRACWKAYLGSRYEQLYDIATIEVTASSGTYMRSLAHELGERLSTPALASSIVRTSVGMYTLSDALRDFKPSAMPGILS